LDWRWDWTLVLGVALFVLAPACGDDEGDSSSATDGDACNCLEGAYVPVCGVDEMTYDATCGNECVPVEIACMGECPCPTLACGEEECGVEMPVCTEVSGGAEPTVSYSCGVLPRTCAGVEDPDCACVQPGGGCECVEGPEDYFYVSCAAP
jgi:hypothetical protein